MKKYLIGSAIIAAALVVVFFISQQGTMAFHMKYHGLNGAKDELRYNSYWGFGVAEEDTPFIKEVRKNAKNIEIVYNRYFKGAEWSAVEYEDQKVTAFYFDLNADGKLSDNEKIPPVNIEVNENMRGAEFVTPDFIANTDDGRQVPFRVLLQANFYEQSSSPNCMWSPSCVLEGTSTVDGEPTKLILFASGFPRSFKEFGRSSYSLVSSKAKNERQTLSSIINYNEQFYYLRLNGSHEQGKSIRAAIEKYTGATGELAAKLAGDTNLNAELSSANIIGSKDSTIQFNISKGQSILPTGVYKLERGYIHYGREEDDKWQVSFTEGNEFTINADKTCNVELGKPELTISAVDENRRYNNPKEQRVYSKGTNIYITRIIKGKAGETYGRFSNKRENIEPEIRIVDADGKEIVAATKIKYG